VRPLSYPFLSEVGFGPLMNFKSPPRSALSAWTTFLTLASFGADKRSFRRRSEKNRSLRAMFDIPVTLFPRFVLSILIPSNG